MITQSRRCLSAVASRFANRRFVFAIAAVSLLSAKALHVYAHISAFTFGDLALWGITFWTQDLALLIFLRWILFMTQDRLYILMTAVSSLIVLASLTLASINISFYVVAGSELHWRNIGLAGDSSSWDVLLTGLFALEATLAGILFISWVLQDFLYIVSTLALDVIRVPFSYLSNKYGTRRSSAPAFDYAHVPQQDADNGSANSQEYDDLEKVDSGNAAAQHRSHRLQYMRAGLYMTVAVSIVLHLLLTLLQPDDSSYEFMSWAVPLLPLMDFLHASPTLTSSLPLNRNGTSGDIHNRTALGEPIHLTWLPQASALPATGLDGFSDWYDANATHYRADADPLKVSNLDDELLPELKDKLKSISIRHVVLIKLESTRKDVFPLKRNGQFWDKLAATWGNKSLPEEAKKRLATLTPTANLLTGDYDDGFPHAEKKRRGGINVKSCHTTGTYTLKSLAGTLCGVTPLLADFNVEFDHHVYQPCLAHIFDAFNTVKREKKAGDYKSFKWRNSFMQSTTGGYDKQDKLMPVLGYKDERFLQGEYLKSDEAKFGKADLEDVNYYGMPEIVLDQYIRDLFQTAKKDDERVFLAHLTSTSHHPFGIPKSEKYVKLNGDKDHGDLSKYTNSIGYVDGWLGKFLNILEDEDVAKETLVVLVGDHGLSIPETGSVTPYGQPNWGNFHVPLVLSHPDLPPIDIDGAVNSIQVLPSILDILIESGSMSKEEGKAARELAKNYEGQSLIRPLRNESMNGEGNWQFTVTNPGGAQISVRDARHQEWRIVIPAVADTEWRFTNPVEDMLEKDPIYDFGMPGLRKKVEEKYGKEAGEWVEEAAFVTSWWVDENRRRWRYK